MVLRGQTFRPLPKYIPIVHYFRRLRDETARLGGFHLEKFKYTPNLQFRNKLTHLVRMLEVLEANSKY